MGEIFERPRRSTKQTQEHVVRVAEENRPHKEAADAKEREEKERIEREKKEWA